MQGVEGFIRSSGVSWERQEDLTGQVTPGQKIEAVITRFDKDSKRINLSIRKLTADPFEKLVEKFAVDMKVSGTVLSIDDAGVSVALQEGVDGFNKKEKIPPMTTYSNGQDMSLTVSEFDKKRHRIILTPGLKEKPIREREVDCSIASLLNCSLTQPHTPRERENNVAI